MPFGRVGGTRFNDVERGSPYGFCDASRDALNADTFGKIEENCERLTVPVDSSDIGKMDWLNYHHLFYFMVIAQEGGIAPAARKLRLTHSTLCAQLKTLEEHLGAQLFERSGRRLVLTSFGNEAAAYASDIFRLGRELNDIAKGRVSPRRQTIRIGTVPDIPKTLVPRLLCPVLEQFGSGTAFIRQDATSTLVKLLATGRLNLALVNEVPAATPGIRIHAHELGETEILLYGSAALARGARRRFPQTLTGTPFVLPQSGTPLRKRLDAWFAKHQVEVNICAEVGDSGLLRAFGIANRGIFPVRAALATEVEDLQDMQLVGKCEGISERYYALTTDRRVKHPAISALIEGARANLNAASRGRRHDK